MCLRTFCRLIWCFSKNVDLNGHRMSNFDVPSACCTGYSSKHEDIQRPSSLIARLSTPALSKEVAPSTRTRWVEKSRGSKPWRTAAALIVRETSLALTFPVRAEVTSSVRRYFFWSYRSAQNPKTLGWISETIGEPHVVPSKTVPVSIDREEDSCLEGWT